MSRFHSDTFYCVCNENESHVFNFRQAQGFLHCTPEALREAIKNDEPINGFYIDEIEE